MVRYAGKKVVLFSFDPNEQAGSLLQQMEVLQQKAPQAVFLALPVSPTDAPREFQRLQVSKSNLLLARPYAPASNENQFAAWLSDPERNGHFSVKQFVAGQVFVISEKGTLFAVFEKNAPTERVLETIESNFSE